MKRHCNEHPLVEHQEITSLTFEQTTVINNVWVLQQTINYRDNKSFENKLFREELFELSNSTLEENANGFEGFIEICQKTLNHGAPAKQKFVRYTQQGNNDRTRFRNILEIKLTKTKDSIQNNKIIVPQF